MHNKLFLHMWIISQISEMETEIKRLPSEQFTAANPREYQELVEKGLKLHGKLELLEQMFEYFKLDQVETDSIVHHTEI